MAIREFHEVRLAIEIALRGNAIDEVIGRLYPVTGRGKFATQMICPFGPGIFLTASNGLIGGRWMAFVCLTDCGVSSTAVRSEKNGCDISR